MPIFAYRCDSCGFEQDVLQKRSDAPLTTCPSCARETFAKRLTAPAFQLKGSGWYATDFRDNGKAKAGAKEQAAPAEDQSAQPGAGAAGGEAPSTAKAPSPAESPASSPASSATPAAPASSSKAA